MSCSMIKMLISVDFEVFGRVQGVFFRKYTQKQANGLNITGYVVNTGCSTVVGCIEGEKSKIDVMKQWLCYVGSPHSKIQRCEFKNEKIIDGFEHKGFRILH